MSTSLPKFLTSGVASEAIRRVALPLFEGDDILMKRRMAHIVVLVPRLQNGCILPYLLYEHSIGDIGSNPFDEIARNKALQLWEGRNDGRTDIAPHLLYPGDTPFWGGVKRHGFVVACSGVESWFDQMIAGMVADAIVALAYQAWMNSPDRASHVYFLT